MKESEFWERMDAHLGRAYARTWASQQHLTRLDGLTVEGALAAGYSCKQVWRVVAAALDLAPSDS
ncbi:MAG TPA: DUF3046 domain-containing protein [Candidatus Avipropionibacterium avicola]|uniref:DUF3046 domain-containing protein n=1 Tax=Candidatus Avipropionibacterium avicola TaxID=2840701 RepID=A0A9D1GWB9_9ACTN|nr:DUF3046 domain-containing protein [Candidatus Avipropionibacterium avicola]